MSVAVTDEIEFTRVDGARPSEWHVDTIVSRDRVGGNGVMRVGESVYVDADSTRYRLTAIGPEVWEIDTSGSYSAVATLAARALLSPTTGDRVRVLSLPYVYEYDGTDWNKVETVPNKSQAYIDVANLDAESSPGTYDGIFRFIDPANTTTLADDENDGLTRTTPWLTLERAFDEIPDDSRLGTGSFGGSFFRFVLMSDGGAPPVSVEFNNFSGTVAVEVVADLDNQTPYAALGIPPLAGVLPLAVGTNLTTKTMSSQMAKTGFAAFAQPVDGEHYVTHKLNFGGEDFYYSHPVDGTLSDGPAGELRIIVSLSDHLGTTAPADLWAYSMSLGYNEITGNANFPRLHLNSRGVTPAQVKYFGLQTGVLGSVCVDGVGVDGCLLRSPAVLFAGAGVANTYGGPVVSAYSGIVSLEAKSDISSHVVSGLFLRKPSFRVGNFFISGMMLRAPATGTPNSQMVFGATTTSSAGYVSCEINRMDVDGQGSAAAGFWVRADSVVRAGGDAQGVVFLDVGTAVRVSEGGRFTARSRLYGSADGPIVVDDGGTAVELANIEAATDGLQNRTTAGENVKVGTAPAVDYSGLPFTDVLKSARAS